jgi:thiol-disulfide isomerase/thioredoxin
MPKATRWDTTMPISTARRQQALTQTVTFEQFLATVRNFESEFRANYAAAELDDRDRALLARIGEPVEVLAIVEDWCTDVVANLPILARIADDTDKLILHVLVRDDTTRDVADAYPFQGRSHIPTYVIFDRDGNELGVLIERTDEIRERVDAFLETFFAAHAELNRANFPAGLGSDLKTELIESSLRLRRGLRQLERHSLIDAITTIAGARSTDPIAFQAAR